jgi:cytochrome c551/c552
MRLPLAIAAAFTTMALSGPVLASSAEDIMAKEKCSKCHTSKTTKKGPSFASIAEKNQGKPDAVARLVNVLKTGGPEDHDKIAASDADLKAIVELVLSAK